MDYNFKNIYIGTIIKEFMQDKNIEENRILYFLKIQKTSLHLMYKEKSLDSEIFLKWSKLLKYNLSRTYSQHLILYAPAPKTIGI